MNITFAFTHAAFCKERVPTLERATSALLAQGLNDIVIYDDHEAKGNLIPWMKTLRLALDGFKKNDFIVMLPDDVLLAHDFRQRIFDELFKREDTVQCLYPNHAEAADWTSKGYRAYWTVDGFAGFAVFPYDLAVEFLEWRKRALKEPDKDSRSGGSNSDEQVALWLMSTRRSCRKPLPGLVDHDHSLTSLEGHDTDAFRRSTSTRRESAALLGDLLPPMRTYDSIIPKLLTHLREPDHKLYYEMMSTPAGLTCKEW